jgi:hypothetical protein
MAFRIRRLAWALLLACASGAWARLPARASELHVSLDAQLPPALQRCVSREQLRARYVKVRDASSNAEARRHPLQELWVGLRIASQDGELAQLELTAATRQRALGTRVLPVRVADCAALPETLALVLWLLSQSAEPVAAPAPPPPSAAEVAERDAELPRGQRSPPRQSQAQAQGREPGIAIGLGLGGGAAFGVLPRAALQLQLSAELRAALVGLRVRAALLWPQAQAIAEGSVSMSTYEIALEACPSWRVNAQPALELRACAGPRLGLLRSKSSGFLVHNADNIDLLVYAGASLEAALALGSTRWLALSTGLALALERPQFVLQFANTSRQRSLEGPALMRGDVSLGLLQMF